MSDKLRGGSTVGGNQIIHAGGGQTINGITSLYHINGVENINFHIDAQGGAGLYLNWHSGQGTHFGNGAHAVVGSINTSGDMRVSGNMYVNSADGTTGGTQLLPISGGTITGNLTVDGTFLNPSDINLKENLEVIPSAMDKIVQISGYTYNLKTEPNTRMSGLIAQELMEVLPEAVHEMEDGNLAISYNSTIGLLVEAIKELNDKIDALEAAAL